MKVGVNEAVELKALEEQTQIPFADLLRAYALEDFLLRIEGSDYREYLWLTSDRMLGEAAYRKGGDIALAFTYHKDKYPPAAELMVAGQELSPALAEQMMKDVLMVENKRGILWEGRVFGMPSAVTIELRADYKDMQIPLTVEIRQMEITNQRSETKSLAALTVPGAEIVYRVYSCENQVSSDLFGILEKLELIGDMGAYYRVYQTLRTQPLSARYLIEELEAFAGHKPKVRQERRIVQLAGYRDYTYMRKRWEQYVKRQQVPEVPWEEALDLILALAEPIWKSFCSGEVFLADWMPELERFM